MFTQKITRAINICFKYNIPFVAYSLPNENKITFFANPSAPKESKAHFDGRTEFIISYFNNDYPYIIGIQPEMTADEIIAHKDSLPSKEPAKISPWMCSTDYMQYCNQVHQLVKLLRKRDGKTVLSRVITGNIITDWQTRLDSLFISHSNSFRHIYLTRETGCWFGATPEILLDYNSISDQFITMSLAGTRLQTLSNEAWDKKNICEHDFVTNYIQSTLRKLHIEPHVGNAETVSYGEAEHLCHKITGKLGQIKICQLLQALSPTPAVAGFPKEEAISDIENFEVHPRYCYAGYIGVCKDTRTQVYVNLRCGHTDGKHICVYGGGGLTAESKAKDEWFETEVKTNNLRLFIENRANEQ